MELSSIIKEFADDNVIRDLSISPKKWSNQILELSEICNSSNTREAVKHLMQQGSMFLRAEIANSSKPDITFSETDAKRISSFLDRKQKLDANIIPKEINPKIFRKMLHEISTNENDPELIFSLQDSLPYIKACLSQIAIEKEKWITINSPGIELAVVPLEHSESCPFNELADFIHMVNTIPTLQNCLLLMKLLLVDCAAPPTNESATSSISTFDVTALTSQLSTCSILDRGDLESISQMETFKEHMGTFVSMPRIVLRSGQPVKLSTSDVTGAVSGFIGGLSINDSTSEKSEFVYYEVVFKTKSFNDVRVGWALCGSRLQRGEIPGDSNNCWVYEPATQLFYHDAAKIAAAADEVSNRAEKASSSSTLNDEKKSEEKIEKGAFSEKDEMSGLSFKEEAENEAASPKSDSSAKSNLLKLLTENFLLMRRAAAVAGDRDESAGKDFSSGSINYFNPSLFGVDSAATDTTDTEVTTLDMIKRLMLSNDASSEDPFSPYSRSVPKDENSNSSGDSSNSKTSPIPTAKSDGKNSNGGERLSNSKLDQQQPLSSGLVVGCLLNTKTKEMRFYHNGVLAGSKCVGESLSDSAFNSLGLCPTFYSSSSGTGLEINIGYSPFRNARSVLQDVISDLTIPTIDTPESKSATDHENLDFKTAVSDAVESGPMPSIRHDCLLQFKRNSYLTFRRILEDTEALTTPESSESNGSGIVIENVHSDSLKTMSFEASVCLAHPSNNFNDITTATKWFNIISCGSFLSKKSPSQSGSVSSGEETKLPCEDCGCNFGVNDTGAMYFELFGCETVTSRAKVFTPNKWHHVAVAYTYHRSTSKSNLSIHLDGAVIHQCEILGNKKNKTSKLQPRNICIGNVLGYNSRSLSSRFSWVGSIDQVRVWTVSRSNEKIANYLGKSKITGLDSDLMCYLTFDEGCGNTLHDSAATKSTVRSTSTIHLIGNFEWETMPQSFDYVSPVASTKKDAEVLKDSMCDPSSIGVLVDALDELENKSRDSDPGNAQQLDLTIAKKRLIVAVTKKLFIAASKIAVPDSSKGRSNSVRQFQNRVSSMQSFVSPTKNNLLLLNSLLNQLIVVISSSDDTTYLYILVARCVINALRVIFRDVSESSSPISGLHAHEMQLVVQKLTITLLTYISGIPIRTQFISSVVELRQEAISTFICGIDFLVPQKTNQFFMLECLIMKHFKDKSSLSSSVLHEVLSLLASQPSSEEDTSSIPLQAWSDPLFALLSLSPAGAKDLFDALCKYMAKPSFLVKIVPFQFRPILRDQYPGPFGGSSNLKPTTDPGIVPRNGDSVVRGPHWRYGNQDGEAGSLGVIIDVNDWQDKAQPNTAVTVLWKNGYVNTYRWALFDSAASAEVDASKLPQLTTEKYNGFVYDVSILLSTTAFNNILKNNKTVHSILHQPPEKSSTVEMYAKKDLTFTPTEVSNSLVNSDEGNDAITKRSVLLYIRDNSPSEWQEKMNINQPINTLLTKKNFQDIVDLYGQFYTTFSSQISASVPQALSATSCSSPDSFKHLVIEPRNKFSTEQRATQQRLLHFLSLLVEYVQAEKSSPQNEVLVNLQSMLVGVFESSDSFFNPENNVVIHKSSHPLVTEPFETREGQKMVWNWKAGSWEEVPLSEPAKTVPSKDASSSSVKFLTSLSVDRNYIGANLMVTSRSKSIEIVHSGDREWNTCICTTEILPNTGIHKWYVKIKNFSERRGHCMLGVATKDFSYDEFLGQDPEGWGLSPNLDLFHAGRKRKADSEKRLSLGCVIEITLDSNAGTLSFLDLTSDSPDDSNSLSFDSLKGMTVHPAFSLYAPGECISLITSLEDIQRLRLKGNVTTNNTGRRKTEAPTSLRPQFLGSPSSFLLNYSVAIIKAVCEELDAQSGSENYSMHNNVLVSLCLPQLLSSLYRWQKIPRYVSKNLMDSLGALLNSIRKNTQLSLGRESLAAAPNECRNQEILLQLVCMISGLNSKILADMIRGDKGNTIDNLTLAVELSKSKKVNTLIEYFKFDPITGASTNDNAFGVLRVAPENWLNNPLFSQGYLDSSDSSTELLLRKQHLYSAESSTLIRWVSLHDRTHPNFKRFGGEVFHAAVNSLFNVNIFHSGFLSSTVNIQNRLKEYLAAHSETPVDSILAALKPPMYILLCWEAAMKIRTWGREIASKGVAYEFLVDHVCSRAQYLLGVEPCTVEQYYDNMESDFVNWLASSYPTTSPAQAEKHIQSISTNTKLFVTDSCSLVHLKVLNSSMIRRAEYRRDGMKFMRNLIDSLSTVTGFGAKCALLNKLPEAIKGENLVSKPKLYAEVLAQSSKNSPIRNRQPDHYEGHYLCSLDGVSRNLRMELQGAFDSLYDCLAQELLSSSNEDACTQLCLIECLGVRVLEQDHTMLARVNLFYILQDILENSMSSSVFTLVRPNLEKGDCKDELDAKSTGSELNKAAVKAAMKLFILIALQVATAKDTSASEDISIHSLSTSVSPSAPVLRKSKSGPATLSKAVFDILFSQLHDVSAMMVEAVDPSSAENVVDETVAPFLCISQNSLMIISETTNLLLCVSKNSVCQQLLMKSKWLTLLLQMSNTGPSLCQQRSLQLLSDILPLLSPDELEAEVLQDMYLMTWFEKSYVESWSVFSKKKAGEVDSDEAKRTPLFDVSLPEAIILSVLSLIGRMLTNSSPKLVVVNDSSDFPKAITDLLLPIVSESIALLRLLYLSKSWHSTLYTIFVGIVHTANKLSYTDLTRDISLVHLLTATLSVCGGHIDTPYLNSPVLFQVGDGPHRIGIFSDLHDSQDKILVTTYSSGPVDLTSSLLIQEVLTVPLEKVTAINRCPIEKVQLSGALLTALTILLERLVLSAENPEEAREKNGGSTSNESKDENPLTFIEEKTTEPQELVGDISCPFINNFKEFLLTLCTRIFATIATNKSTLGILCNDFYPTTRIERDSEEDLFHPDKYLLKLLKFSQQRNRSCGLQDVPVYEEYLMILMRQRQKLWAAKQAELSKSTAATAAAAASGKDVTESSGFDSTSKANLESLNANDLTRTHDTSETTPSTQADSVIEALSALQTAWGSPSLATPAIPTMDEPINGAPDADSPIGEDGINTLVPSTGALDTNVTEDSNPVPDTIEEAYEFPDVEGDGDGDRDRVGDRDRDRDGDQDDHAHSDNSFLVESLEGMGFPRKWCEIALEMCGYDPEEALNYILTNGISLDDVANALDRADNEREREGGDSGGDSDGDDDGDGDGGHFLRMDRGIPDVMKSSSSPNRPQTASGIPKMDTDHFFSHIYHYDGAARKLLAFYSEPKLNSERIGCIYPGDDLSVVEVIEDPGDTSEGAEGRGTWYKLSFADFDDGSYQNNQKDVLNINVYVPRYVKGQQVIMDGPSDGEVDGSLEDPPGETLHFTRNYKVIGTNGVLVRQGTEICSGEVCSLRVGDVVRAVEETFNSEGTLRLKIDQPVVGYISKLLGLVERLPDSEEKILTEKNNESENGFSLAMALLEKLEDNMEMSTANDSFSKDHRFFGSLQGNQYVKFAEKGKSIAQGLYHRRLRISGSSSYQAYMQGSVTTATIASLDDAIVKILKVLRILYIRRLLLAIVLQSMGDLRETVGESGHYSAVKLLITSIQPQSSIDALISTNVIDTDESIRNPVAVADHLFNFIRQLVFRGEPFSYTGLESLSFKDMVFASLAPWSVSVEQIIELLLADLIRSATKRNDVALPDTMAFSVFQDIFVSKLCDSIFRSIRLACTSKYSDYCWADASYEEDLDEELSVHPNLNYASWLTLIIVKNCSEDIAFVLFKAWVLGLRGSSVSQKNIALHTLDSMISHIHGSFEAKVTARCLDLLPMQRLKKFAAKRLWQELEDHPSYSRFLQSLIGFLTEIELVAAVTPTPLLSNIEENKLIPIPDGEEVAPQAENSRAVVSFISSKSHIVLNPQKDLSGPWTVEFWLGRRRDTSATTATASATSVSAAAIDVAKVLPPSTNDRFDKYRKMVKLLPVSAVKQKMSIDGLSVEEIDTFFADIGTQVEQSPSPVGSQPTSPPTLKSQYLLTGAKNSYIKIQCGGRLFNLPAEENGGSDTVVEEAYCVSIGQQGSVEKVFDYAIPFDEWVHVCLVCQVSPIGIVTLYVNGEVKDSISYTIPLPLSCIGSTQDLSFTGEIGEMRIWSVPRSPMEIQRDMIVDVSEAKYLLSVLRCNDGSGLFAHDSLGNFNFCKLMNCDWATSTQAAVIRKKTAQGQLFEDIDNVDILFGDEMNPLGSFSELTGTICIPAVLGAEGELASNISEVVCLCYRPKIKIRKGQSTFDEVPIEGYLQWCDRNARSMIVGKSRRLSSIAESVTITVLSNATFDGAPEKLEWLQNITFEGHIIDGALQGSFSISVLVDAPIPLDPGGVRIDKFTIPPSIKYSSDTKKGVLISSTVAGIEHLSVVDTADEGQYVVEVEVAPFKKNETDSSSTIAGKESDFMIDQPEKSRYGICANEGSIWLEWLIVSSAGSIGFGVCTQDALTHPDACVDANDNTWTYSVSGQASHGADLYGCDIADDGDTIGIHIDTDDGILTFYKNNQFIIEFNSLNNHVSMNLDSTTQGINATSGVRPFVSLTSTGDKVSFLGMKSGSLELHYPSSIANDICYEMSARTKQLLGSSLFCQVKDGSVNGFGFSFSSEASQKWFGTYANGYREGFHALIVESPAAIVSPSVVEAEEATASVSSPAVQTTTEGAADTAPVEAAVMEAAALSQPSESVPSIDPQQSPIIKDSMEIQIGELKFYRKGEAVPSEGQEWDEKNFLKVFVEDFVKVRAKELPSYMIPSCLSITSPPFSGSASTIGNSMSPPWPRGELALPSLSHPPKEPTHTTNTVATNAAGTSDSSGGGGEGIPNMFRFASSPSTDEKINVRVHDGGLDEFIFRVPRSIVFQKIIDAYASRKTFQTTSLVFKFKDTVLQGNRTVDSYAMVDNSIVNVSIRSVTSENWQEINEFIDTSTAPYVLKILYESGATVRNGIEIEDSTQVRTLRSGEVVEAFRQALTTEKISRYQIADGWISERLRGGTESLVTQMLYERLPEPLHFRVTREEGAKIRKSYAMDSEDLGFCPVGTLITVTEKRYVETEKKEYTTRVKIVSPPEWRGWVSLKDHLLEQVASIPASESSADPAILVELDRRAKVQSQRKLRAKMRAKLSKSRTYRRCVKTSGSFDLSTDTFFLLRKGHKSGSDRSDRGGPKISPDFLTVSGDESNSHRALAFGSRGFSRGVHYWEVKVLSAGWGSVFIGVAPDDSSSWNGYGLLNYRATQAFGTETIYGSYFGVNDTVGVLLNMDFGTISFFKDGEDFNAGRVNVVNMGVAYHNMRKTTSRFSSAGVLYPCLGVKSPGDQLSVVKSHWVSHKGLASNALLQRILYANKLIHSWSISYKDSSACLTDDYLHRMHSAYTLWRQSDIIPIKSRPGILVYISTSKAAIANAAGPAIASSFNLTANIPIRTQYGNGVLLGARGAQLWYSYDLNNGSDSNNWYWNKSEIPELLGNGTISFNSTSATGENEGTTTAIATATASTTTSVEPDTAIAQLSESDFRNGLCGGSPWTVEEDKLICQLVNSLTLKKDIDPLRVSTEDIEHVLSQHPLFKSRTSTEMQARYTALCVLNRAASVALPFIDFNCGDGRAPLLRTDLKDKSNRSGSVVQHTDSSFVQYLSVNSIATALLEIKEVIFTQTKMTIWNQAIKETTTPTSAPPDEYERPEDLKEININRVEARNVHSMNMKDTLTFSERLKISVFGQLKDAMTSWDDRSLRRAFIHMQDAGQSRAFFVKFTGEGVDDQGGPYRAVFETAVGEETTGLLDLLVPCPNAVAELGENRDKFLLNPNLIANQPNVAQGALTFLGKLIGMACRHNIMVPLSLPKLLWKPLVGERVTLSDLLAVDCKAVTVSTLTSLTQTQNTSSSSSSSEQILTDLLLQAFLSASHAFAAVSGHVSSSIDAATAKGMLTQAIGKAQGGDPDLVSPELCAVVETIQRLQLLAQSATLTFLYRGLSAVIPCELLPMFSADEVESMLCGQPEVDLEVLKKATVYEAVSPTDSHVIHFWAALEELNKEELAELINFCSGRSRLPASASEFPMPFKLSSPPPHSEKDPDHYLPIARTCFFTLSLPKYSSVQVCVDKLRYAIHNTELMDADFIDRRATSGWENIR